MAEKKFRVISLLILITISTSILLIFALFNLYFGIYRENLYSGLSHYNFSPSSLETELAKSNYISKLPKNPNVPYRIALIFKYDVLAAMRIQQAANNLGWESLLISIHKTPINPLDVIRIHGIVSQFNPDFTISSINLGSVAGTKNYFIWHFPCSHSLSSLQDYCPTPFLYDGLLAVSDNEKVEQLYGKLSVPIVDFKFSRPTTGFVKVTYSRLFMCGYNWDKMRSGPKYKELYKLLDTRDDIDIYGPKSGWGYFNSYKSYRGFIPNNDQLFVNAIRRSGIGLAIHSEEHKAERLPSAKLLEIVSSSGLAITDEMPWAKETFGDNVLYIETLNKSVKEIYDQISKHLEWIKSNPDQAYVKARNAHQIYLNQFTMEQILQNIANMHDQNNL